VGQNKNSGKGGGGAALKKSKKGSCPKRNGGEHWQEKKNVRRKNQRQQVRKRGILGRTKREQKKKKKEYWKLGRAQMGHRLLAPKRTAKAGGETRGPIYLSGRELHLIGWLGQNAHGQEAVQRGEESSEKRKRSSSAKHDWNPMGVDQYKS